MDFLKLAENIQEELIGLRRDFHQYPESGYKEVRTSSKIKIFLEKEGIEYTETAKTGICAVIYGSGEKTIALRGDIDALPIQEKNQCEYCSKIEGMMHACGHDAHTAILLGAGKILNSIKSELKGNVKLFFEPAEETSGGATVMIEEGVLENPEVNAVIGLHVSESIPTGKIGIKTGVVNAASNPFTIKIIGKGGHGAGPETTIDPIVISSHVVLALQDIISRELPPTSPAVITIGTIHGGSAQNIIPDEVTISGIIRTMERKHREYVIKRLAEITEGIVKAMRGKCVIDIEESYPCLYNDDNMVDLLMNAATDTLGKNNILALENPTMGVESFAYFSMERPSAFYFLGCGNSEKGIIHPLHNSKFDIDENCLAVGVAVQCSTAYEFLNRNVHSLEE